MRTDVLEMEAFYKSPLGIASAKSIGVCLHEAWGALTGLRVAGFGYPHPYMPFFATAERTITVAPEGMGVALSYDDGAARCTAVAADTFWPLPDASIDRIIIIHGLEETATPQRLMREIWRVLADDGRLIAIVPNRRGPWSMVETTPFSAGRPYSRVQLSCLLHDSMFMPVAWNAALYFPPMHRRFLIRAAPTWERVGRLCWSAFAGVTLVEAAKRISMPVRTGQINKRLERAQVTSVLPRTHRTYR